MWIGAEVMGTIKPRSKRCEERAENLGPLLRYFSSGKGGSQEGVGGKIARFRERL